MMIPKRALLLTVILGTFAFLPNPLLAQDGDGDGLPDSLELALAQRFFPLLNLHCGTFRNLSYGDRRQLYGHSVPGYTDSSNGRIPFVVHPYDPGNGSDCAEPFQCLEIRYGIAWNWDLGDDFWREAHSGDSEMYAVLVARKDTSGGGLWGVSWGVAQYDAGQWRLMREFMSAHWLSGNDFSSYRSHGVFGNTSYQRVWCAEGKHAMYPSKSSCDAGGVGGIDNCGDNRCDIRADVVDDLQNVGEFWLPLARYIPNPAPARDVSPSGNYDVWGGAPFGVVTDYKRVLTTDLGWCRTYQEYCPSDCLIDACPDGDRYVQGSCPENCMGDGLRCEIVRCY
jgi:hypothetical protein